MLNIPRSIPHYLLANAKKDFATYFPNADDVYAASKTLLYNFVILPAFDNPELLWQCLLFFPSRSLFSTY